MLDQTVKMSLLLDTYGELLTQKQRACFDLYHNQDLSLAEIAEAEGISRQGVHDSLARAESILLSTEQKLGCLQRELELQKSLRAIADAANVLQRHADPAVRTQADAILSAVLSLEE